MKNRICPLVSRTSTIPSKKSIIKINTIVMKSSTQTKTSPSKVNQGHLQGDPTWKCQQSQPLKHTNVCRLKMITRARTNITISTTSITSELQAIASPVLEIDPHATTAAIHHLVSQSATTSTWVWQISASQPRLRARNSWMNKEK